MSSTRRVTTSSTSIRGSACSSGPCCARSRGVGPPRSAAMSISAAPADIGPSPTTRVAIGTVRSVRRRRASGGSPRVSASCSTCRTSMSSSRCRTRCCRSATATPRGCITWLFQASAATLLEVAADPQHLGAEIGFLSILHTWGQTLVRHPHVHCVVPAGGLSPDHQRWIRPKYAGFFLPVKVLSRVFRGKFVDGAPPRLRPRRTRSRGRHRRPARSGPVARLCRRALSNRLDRLREAGLRRRDRGAALSRALHPSRRDQQSPPDRLRWRARDVSLEGLRPRRPRRTMTLTAMEFLRRFVQHVLPRGFVRIRQFGYLASACRTARLALARRLLAKARTTVTTSSATEIPSSASWVCPRCGAAMILAPILSALKLRTIILGFDTS